MNSSAQYVTTQDANWHDGAMPLRKEYRSSGPANEWSSSPPSYDDEAPVINVNYANRQSNGDSSPKADEEEDNSSYQNVY